MTLFDTLRFSLAVTGPIFLWMLAGYLLARAGYFPAWIRHHINRFIFYVSLPLLMFISILQRPIGEVWEPTLTAILCGVTLTVFALAGIWSRQAGKASTNTRQARVQAAVVSQAAFRGNLGIIGIYLCLNAFGDQVLPVASLLMALVSILYNALSVFVFEAAQQDVSKTPAYRQWRVWLNILLNPLILATLVALLLSAASVAPPPIWLHTGGKFVAMTFPLALMSIGASLVSKSVEPAGRVMRTPWYLHPMCTVLTLKLLVKPFLAVTLAWLLGYRGMLLGVVFFFAAAPTAAASFVVAKAYGGDEGLAAKTIAYSSALSLLSISAGVFILRALGWV